MYVRLRAVSFDPNPQPGIVEAILTDADGREWRLREKSAYFREYANLDAPSLPMMVSADCVVVGGDDHRVR